MIEREVAVKIYKLDGESMALVGDPEILAAIQEALVHHRALENAGRCTECGGQKCILPECDRPYDQFEGRLCPSCEKYRSTCANDHCMECGDST